MMPVGAGLPNLLLQQAIEHHQSGRLDQAEALYRQILALAPGLPAAHHLAGLLDLERGRPESAIPALSQAARLDKAEPRYPLDQGRAEAARGQAETARACWRRAQRLARASGEMLMAIGQVQASAGFMEDAATSFRQAAKFDSHRLPALNNLGSALAWLGRFDEAAASYRAALALDPRYVEAILNLASACSAGGDHEAALATYREALALDPNLSAAQRGLGDAWAALGRLEEAVAAYREALRLQPDLAEAASNLGTALGNLGRRDEACAAYEAALRHRPNLLAAQVNLAVARLPLVYRDEAEIEAARAAYGLALDGLGKAPLPVALDVEATGGVPPFYLTYQGRDDRDLQMRYGAHVTRVMQALHPRWAVAPLVERPGPKDQIRVGILSAYFYRHSNWKIPIKGWLAGLDRDRFEVYGYHLGGREDQETETARALCRRFISGPRRLAEWVETIRADRLHVLLVPGIGMDPLTTRLAALKLAPVQATSWGHPETSGLPSIDHFLSSALMEPPGADAHYTERLIRLPNLSIAYATLPVEPAPVTRAALGIPVEATFYWCCQSLYKYLPRYDSVFPAIAAADPAACFAFIAYPGDVAVTEIFRQRLTAVFAARGLDANHFCRFLPRLDAAGFAGVTRLADVFLDSIGWSGCNSTFEALDQGVPVVTLPGELMRGRHSAAILTMLGLPGLIAGSVADYVALAAALGTNKERRAALSETIKRDRIRLYNDRACLDGLQHYLEDAAMERL
jgi:protein O-GlcNAc transferase